MGYFSERDAERICLRLRDVSPLRRITLRLAELRGRREELIESGAICRDWTRIPDDVLAVVSPEYITSVSEADRAITLALNEVAIAGSGSPARLFAHSRTA